MTHTLHDVYPKTLAECLAKWQKRRSRALEPELLDAALMLLNLNLDPIAETVDCLYSDKSRGRPPFDPFAMIRGLMLMTTLQETSIDKFAKDLRTKPRLALTAGFQPNKTPSVGAFYLFIDRLENGPFQSKCPHRVLPAQSRHGQHLRNLKMEKAEKEAERARILAQCDSITRQLKDELLDRESLDRPRDFHQRMEDILFQVAVIPSAKRGMLGDLQNLHYEYMLYKNIKPVVVLNHRKGQHPNPTGTAEKLNDDGIPLCPAGLEMRRQEHNAQSPRLFQLPRQTTDS